MSEKLTLIPGLIPRHFSARSGSTPKSIPDQESLRAAWFFPEEIDSLPLRRETVREIVHYVANGARIYPLDLLTAEGMPFQL